MDIHGFIPDPFENDLDRLRRLIRPLARLESQMEHIHRLTEQVPSANKMLQEIQQTEAYSRAGAEMERMLRQKYQWESQAYAAMELEATIQWIEARNLRCWGDKHLSDRWTPCPPLQSLTFGPSLKDRIKALEERIRQLESMHEPPLPPPDNGDDQSNGRQYL